MSITASDVLKLLVTVAKYFVGMAEKLMAEKK